MMYRPALLTMFVSAALSAAPGQAQVKVPEQSLMINEQLRAVWKANNVAPSAQASNYEFVRRVYLDLVGRIPKPDEVREFINSGGNRPALVNKLLRDPKYSDEFARHMANVWTVWLMTRTGNPTYHEQMHLWLEEQFQANTTHKDLVHQLITAKGKTNDNGAVNFILSHLGERVADGKESEEGYFEMVPITSRTSRLFLGLQTQCVQCHDHPFNPEWKQQAFWGVNAFFRQVKRVGQPIMQQNNMMDRATVLELKDDDEVNKDGIVYYERRNGMILPTSLTFLDGRKAQPSAGKTRRELLSELVTSHDNFAKAAVNRYWGLMMGRSMTEQPVVDDFGEHNKVVHEELLTKLAKEFSYKYDVKDLLFWICCSEAYSLTSVANTTNDKPETDVFFSRMMLKAMTPEQLLESLWVATQGKTASQTGDAKAVKDRRQEWTRKLVQNFGDDEGNEVTFNGTVVQALLMMNGKEINKEITSPNGTLLNAVRKHKGNYGAVINELYLACLGRQPNGAEMSVINRVAGKYGGKFDQTFYTDIMWALLNSNEFILNH